MTDFQNSFTIRLGSKRIMKESLNIPPYLKRIATLPCEMLMSGNYRQSETNVSFNNKFQLNLLQLIMFWLIYVTMNIKNVLLWLECTHGDVCATDQCRSQ